MQSISGVLAMVALAVAFGSLVVGHGVVTPAMLDPHSLVDPNLARAWVTPVTVDIANWVFGATLVLLLVAPRWIPERAVSTVAFVTVVLAAIDRSTAVVALSHVEFTSGQVYDVPSPP